ncbi:hypothetical protein GGI03_000898 [Coemansia sp. RSA 2337]|nr:hypothetical protein GGI03_000898 [Coemansia sp. RSA 2337]
MRILLAFQLLSEHIVRLITDHVACPSRLRFGGEDIESDISGTLQMPLLWTCHGFWAFVFNRFCRKYVLNVCIEPDKYQVTRRSWPYCLEDLDCYPTNQLAKELEIRLDIWDIYAGKALQQLSSDPHDGCVFPLVRVLAFDFRFSMTVSWMTT